MSDHNNIYNIMGKLNALTPVEQTKQEAKPIYESVEAKGSVLEGVKKVQANLEAKLAEHKLAEENCSECGMPMEDCGCDHEETNEERETLKTKTGTIYKGGKYGTSYSSDDDGKKKKKEKKSSGSGEKSSTPKGDIFGRTTGEVPKGTKGTKVKGASTHDTVDEDAGVDKLEKAYTKHMDKAAAGGGDKERSRATKALYVAGADKAEKAYDQYHQKKYGHGVDRGPGTRQQGPNIPGVQPRVKSIYHPPEQAPITKLAEKAPKGWEGTVKAMKKHKEIDNPYALAYSMKDKGYKSHVKEGTMSVGKALMESVNFKKMMDECDMNAVEMIEAINNDLQAYRATGDMTSRLRDFMHLHNHMKKVEEEAASSLAPQMPSGQDVLPQQSTLGKIGSAVKKAFTGPDDAELLARLQQDSQPTVDEELNELAKLAGITDEGNAFTGKLAATPDGGKFELGGKEFTDTSNLEESKKTSLSDIARLSGIFQEGKDYGDTSFNEPPTYDNTPDEQVQGIESQTEGGDGEVAGAEKAMNSTKPTWKNADNALAEDKELIKPAKEFNFVKEMGRDLMKAYEGIKTK